MPNISRGNFYITGYIDCPPLVWDSLSSTDAQRVQDAIATLISPATKEPGAILESPSRKEVRTL
jgi:hypothetical protein